jgi:serine protease Do
MTSEDEMNNSAANGVPQPDLNNTMPNQPASPNYFSAEPMPPKAPEQAAEQRGRAAGPNMYYEPWQEPVYGQPKTPGQEPYSPGIHSGAYYVHQRPPVYAPPPEKKKKSVWTGLVKVICLVLICALAAGGATYGVLQLGGSRHITASSRPEASAPSVSSPAAPSSPATPDGSPNAAANLTTTGKVMSAEDIYAMAVSQVVGVNSEAKTNAFGQITSSPVSGSGFIISADGYVVTNFHVIQYAVAQNSELTVMTHDGKSYAAKVVGYEQDNDLAVIKIDATGLNAVTLGTNKDMKVGNQIYTVGNPLGELTYTMTSGIVSALDREITEEDGTRINMFQIDAAVNPGNSGGPVYNDRGEVLGIVSAKFSSTGVEGLGFAIPIDDANNIISQLMTTGRVAGKPSMGISVSTVNSASAQYYNLVEGAYVETVAKGSAADKAGIKVGDIIVKMGDKQITSKDDLVAAKKTFKAGDTTTIVVYREGKEQTLNITFDEEGVTATASEAVPGTGSRSAN